MTIEHPRTLKTETPSGGLRLASLPGDVWALPPLPGPCSIVMKDDAGVYLACGQMVWRV